MAQTADSIATTIKEVHMLVRNSDTPISVLSLQATILLGREDWSPREVERVSSEVMGLLIHQGWKNGQSL